MAPRPRRRVPRPRCVAPTRGWRRGGRGVQARRRALPPSRIFGPRRRNDARRTPRDCRGAARRRKGTRAACEGWAPAAPFTSRPSAALLAQLGAGGGAASSGPPGSAPPPEQLSAGQKKRLKEKAKKEAERAEAEAKAELERALGAAASTAAATPAPPAAAPAPAPAAPALSAAEAAAAEADKARKKLAKKLREIEELEARAAAGGALNADQLGKVAARAEVQAALDALSH